ncbi:energy transducer TonB [Telmatospirillum sp.]|uniref:energy transducer TonB n=1 Tax=Telmatospirillum sp. TaxID=2079197 RepID=UPI00285241F9|nr:energy transducer TonB [Telmatospirillum sp.]MDR3438362.1 energy transducer TonB [Telmatospirillum sp.]
MIKYAQQQRATPRKLGGFAVVILLHVLMVYGLVTGSAHRVVEAVRQPLMTKIIQEVKPPDQPPPPPPPKLAPPPPPYIPLPEIQVRQAPTATNAITQVTNTKPVEAPPPAPPAPPAPKHDPVHVAPVASASSCQKPEYPSISRRMEETGTVVLSLLIDLDGKVIDSKVSQSSGHNRLDEAARQALSLCNFKPGTVDGKPEQAWAQIRYTWTLN